MQAEKNLRTIRYIRKIPSQGIKQPLKDFKQRQEQEVGQWCHGYWKQGEVRGKIGQEAIVTVSVGNNKNLNHGTGKGPQQASYCFYSSNISDDLLEILKN